MKNLILLLSFALLSFHSYSQQRLDFQVNEIYNLFGKSPQLVKQYLNDKGYFFEKKDDIFNIYQKDGNEVKIWYKNKLMSLFSFDIPILYSNYIHSEVLINQFTYFDMRMLPLPNGSNNGAYIASYHHSDGKHMCTLLRSPFLPDILQVSFGLLEK